MVGFKVLVNLSQYYSDYRQKSWVYVDPNRLKTLTDLKKHISEVFAIDEDFEVFVSDFYIPTKEDVGIINEKDVLELRRPFSNGDVTGDGFRVPASAEGESKKRKKRKNNDLDSKLLTVKSVDNIDTLSENFHLEYNSNSTARKKRRKNLCSLPIEEIAEDGIRRSRIKKVGKKKSNLTKESCWNGKEVVYSSILQIPNERFDDSTSECVGVEVNETSTVTTVKPTSTKNDLETSVVDYWNVNNSLEVKEVTSGATRNVSSTAQSPFESSFLEHSLLEEDDVAKSVGEVFEIPFQKKRRNRRGRRRNKKYSCDNSSVSDLTTDTLKNKMSPFKQVSINTVPNTRQHMRFSDSGDDEEISVSLTAESNSIDTLGRNESFANEANGTVSVDSALGECFKSSTVGKACISEDASLGNDIKIHDKDSHDQQSGQILTYVGVKDINIPKLPESSSLPVGRRSRKAVLNSGLGATLAHLMKNFKRSETYDSNDIPFNPKDAIKTPPLPSAPNNTSSSSKNYTEFPIVEKFPREGDILAFKILKMNDHYEPCISSFIECVVTGCDENESIVTIRILEGVKEFNRINGKFEVQLECEEGKTENKDVVLTMDWKDIIEPRLIFP